MSALPLRPLLRSVAVAVLVLAAACSSGTEPARTCVPTDAIPPALDVAAELQSLGATVDDLGEPLALLVTPARWRSLRVSGVRIEWYQYCDAGTALAETRRIYPELPAELGNPPISGDRIAWLGQDAYVWIEVENAEVEGLLTTILGPPIQTIPAGGD
jgi:hypothetical protein